MKEGRTNQQFIGSPTFSAVEIEPVQRLIYRCKVSCQTLGRHFWLARLGMILEWLAFGRELEVGRKGVLVLSLELRHDQLVC